MKTLIEKWRKRAQALRIGFLTQHTATGKRSQKKICETLEECADEADKYRSPNNDISPKDRAHEALWFVGLAPKRHSMLCVAVTDAIRKNDDVR